MEKLHLDRGLIGRARDLAASIADDICGIISQFATHSTERTILRLLGVDGVDDDGVPLPNVVVDLAARVGKLCGGIARPFGRAMEKHALDPSGAAAALSAGSLSFEDEHEGGRDRPEDEGWKASLDIYARRAIEKIKYNRTLRECLIKDYGEEEKPWLYCIVATGNIYEDVVQARAAARQGAQIIAVIRSTAQSLLDYVPYGPTTEGFGGTFATQENFRTMRRALDEESREIGRYVRLVNYCSGLCMPEIAAMGALERLDIMLNDAMYGIIFRDINMLRTFVDQNLSRRLNALSGVIITTGEDNYLTTADAYEEAHTVLASQFINEQFALRAGLPLDQIGLGHAFEMDPDLPDGLLYEIAQAQMAREIFPKSPLKYMPPTKFMTGDVFTGHVQDALFVLTSVLTGQSIHLLGMLTEAIHTPFMHDRYLSIKAAEYIRRNAGRIYDEVLFREGGIIMSRAAQVLGKGVALLERIEKMGLFSALEEGVFAGIGRPRDGGKGKEGVFKKSPDYYSPFDKLFEEALS
jgi:beta-lysine 5,6-aminomutase alpha subunit